MDSASSSKTERMYVFSRSTTGQCRVKYADMYGPLITGKFPGVFLQYYEDQCCSRKDKIQRTSDISASTDAWESDQKQLSTQLYLQEDKELLTEVLFTFKKELHFG